MIQTFQVWSGQGRRPKGQRGFSMVLNGFWILLGLVGILRAGNICLSPGTPPSRCIFGRGERRELPEISLAKFQWNFSNGRMGDCARTLRKPAIDTAVVPSMFQYQELTPFTKLNGLSIPSNFEPL
jgi:hypothetical protein